MIIVTLNLIKIFLITWSSSDSSQDRRCFTHANASDIVTYHVLGYHPCYHVLRNFYKDEGRCERVETLSPRVVISVPLWSWSFRLFNSLTWLNLKNWLIDFIRKSRLSAVCLFWVQKVIGSNLVIPTYYLEWWKVLQCLTLPLVPYEAPG